MEITRRVKIAVAAAGISSFALLYAPQSVLPQLSREFHLDPGGASLAISAGTGALALAVLPIAALSEIVGRRRVILVSVISSIVLGLLLPLAPTFGTLLAMRAVQGVAIAGFPGVAAAYLAEQLGTAGVAAAVGAMIAGNTVGGMAGRLATGFTAGALGWHGALAVAAGIALVCGMVTVVALPGKTHQGTFAATSQQTSSRTAQQRSLDAGSGILTGLLAAVRRPVLLVQYAVALLAMGSFVALYNAAGFRLTGHPIDLSPAIASLVFLAYAVGSVSSAMAGRLVSRFGRFGALIGALMVTMLGALLTIPDSLPLVVAGFVVLTGGFFAAHAVANGWAAAAAPDTARGQVSGLYTLLYYAGSSVGGTLGAIAFSHAGWTWLIVLVIGWLGLAALAVVLGVPRGADVTRRQRILSAAAR